MTTSYGLQLAIDRNYTHRFSNALTSILATQGSQFVGHIEKLMRHKDGYHIVQHATKFSATHRLLVVGI
jgi:hypothetical protein